MKNAIFQYYLSHNGVGKPNPHFDSAEAPDWAQYSISYFKKYAEKHDVDYYFSTERYVDAIENHFEQLRVCKDPLFDQYDKVLYLDVDVMPKNMEANIFDEIDVVDIAGWCEWRHPDLAVSVNYKSVGVIQKRYADFGAPMVYSAKHPSDVRIMNTGVLLWSKEARLKARENFVEPDEWFTHNNPALDPTLKSKDVGHSSHCLDQVYLNAMLNKFKFDVVELPIEWNRFPTKDENRPCNFAHYVGNYRFNIPKLFQKI